MKSNSFSGNGKASANLNDLEMFRLLCKTVSYIDAWEKAIGPSLIIQAKNIIKKNQEDAQRHKHLCRIINTRECRHRCSLFL